MNDKCRKDQPFLKHNISLTIFLNCFPLPGYLTGSEDYYTHKRTGYLDLRDNLEPVFNETGHYSAHLFTQKASDVIMAHNSSQVNGMAF